MYRKIIPKICENSQENSHNKVNIFNKINACHFRSSYMNVFYKSPVFKNYAISEPVTLLKRDSLIGVAL